MLSICLILSGCGGEEGGGAEPRVGTDPEPLGSGAAGTTAGGGMGATGEAGRDTQAVARLQPVGASAVAGTLTFTNTGGRLAVRSDLTGLTGDAAAIQVYGGGGCSDPASLTSPLSGSGGGMGAGAGGAPSGAAGTAGSEAYFGRLASGGVMALSPGIDMIPITGPSGLVGKTVVVYAPSGGGDAAGGAAGSTGAMGQPLACGIITADRGGTLSAGEAGGIQGGG